MSVVEIGSKEDRREAHGEDPDDTSCETTARRRQYVDCTKTSTVGCGHTRCLSGESHPARHVGGVGPVSQRSGSEPTREDHDDQTLRLFRRPRETRPGPTSVQTAKGDTTRGVQTLTTKKLDVHQHKMLSSWFVLSGRGGF